ncbi:MAG: hypothetical protein PHR25_05155 [Clostridia bacterium]|nr:hypothetical protein [Clostridia bacterium]MDD4376153.1 hypothetical protein [Clostridia bacterium]
MLSIKTFLSPYQNTIILNFFAKLFSVSGMLAIGAMFAPNFKIVSLPILFLSSLSIIILDYMLCITFDVKNSFISKGFVGFFSACVIIYLTRYIVSGFYISILSSIITAAIYTTVDNLIRVEEYF